MLAGVSTRRYTRLQEPVGTAVEAQSKSTAKSSVSRTFVARTKQTLTELMGRRLDDVRLAVLMLDGIDLKGRTNVVALGISTDGVKIPLGLWEGSSENKTVASALLADLVDRGLDVEQGVLVVIDGAKALRAAVRTVLGARTPVQRCIRHKERNVLDHLPEEMRDTVERRLRGVWALTDHDQALDRLKRLASELEHSHPGAAASLREGLEETLTVIKLGITGKLKQTIESTNPAESMIECIRRSARNVKNWSSGEMAMRWTAAGMLEAEKQFRRVKGHAELANLAIAVERHLNPPQPYPLTSPQPIWSPPNRSNPGDRHRKFHDERDILSTPPQPPKPGYARHCPNTACGRSVVASSRSVTSANLNETPNDSANSRPGAGLREDSGTLMLPQLLTIRAQTEQAHQARPSVQEFRR
jgi:putative transposase